MMSGRSSVALGADVAAGASVETDPVDGVEDGSDWADPAPDGATVATSASTIATTSGSDDRIRARDGTCGRPLSR